MIRLTLKDPFDQASGNQTAIHPHKITYVKDLGHAREISLDNATTLTVQEPLDDILEICRRYTTSNPSLNPAVWTTQSQ